MGPTPPPSTPCGLSQVLGLALFKMLARSSLRATRAFAAAKNGATGAAKRNASTQSGAKNAALLSSSTALAIGSCAWYYYQFGRPAYAMTPAEEGLHATAWWEHEKLAKTFDHQALRRGFQVYREVCSSCHSMSRIPYR